MLCDVFPGSTLYDGMDGWGGHVEACGEVSVRVLTRGIGVPNRSDTDFVQFSVPFPHGSADSRLPGLVSGEHVLDVFFLGSAVEVLGIDTQRCVADVIALRSIDPMLDVEGNPVGKVGLCADTEAPIPIDNCPSPKPTGFGLFDLGKKSFPITAAHTRNFPDHVGCHMPALRGLSI